MAVNIIGIADAHVASDADISASKLESCFSLQFSVTGTIAAVTGNYLRNIRGTTGTIVAFTAAIVEAIATGADRTVAVDLQKSTGAGAFGTVLSSTIGFTNGSTLRAVSTATIATPGLVTLDILRVVITVAGAAGAQAQGLSVTCTIREDPS